MDPVTLTALTVGATLIAGGTKAYGSYETGKATAAMDTAEAGYATQFASAEEQAAQATQYAGGRAAEAVSLRARAAVGRQAVEYGAGNIAGRTPQDVKASQIAIGRQDAAEMYNKYALTAEQESLKGAEYRTTAALKGAAAPQAIFAGDVGAGGDVTAAIGSAAGQGLTASKLYGGTTLTSDASSVAPKWYDTGGGPAPFQSAYNQQQQYG